MRYFLELSYAGEAYHGWQIQPNAISVQELLNNALSTVLRKEIEVTGAGRTDTGVHAIQMFCHFDFDNAIEDQGKFLYNLNSILPKDIAVHILRLVTDNSNARFDAVSRTYVYKLISRKDPFMLNRAWYFPFTLNIDKMNEACKILVKHKNFSCFSKSGTQVKTDKCEISLAEWKENGEEIQFTITADRFLRNMVRAIVGTMIEIGKTEMDLSTFEEVLLSGDRSKAGTSVPAHGLYLSKITYPESIFKD